MSFYYNTYCIHKKNLPVLVVLQHALLRLRFIFVCTFLDTSLCAVVGQGYIYKNTIIKALKIVRNGEGVGRSYIYVIVIVLGGNSMVSSI